MIRYILACDAGHDFESWFPSGAAYDEQAARSLVSCPTCGSTKVGKALMAPSIARGTGGGRDEADAPSVRATEVVSLAEPERRLREMLRALRAHVTQSSDHVGARFADEARAIHYGDAPERSIYGEATAEDARALIDEGIDVLPLPPAPDERN